MQFMGVKISIKEIVITSLFGATIFFLTKNSLAKVAPDIAEKIDPLNDNNIFNEWFEKAYKKITGSDQDLGSDLYDLTHKDVVVPEIPPVDTYDLDFGNSDDGLIYKYKTTDQDYDIDYGGPGSWF